MILLHAADQVASNRRPKLSPSDQKVEDAWDDLKAELRQYAQAYSDAEVKKSLPPYDKPESRIKREIYRFVSIQIKKNNGKNLQNVIESNLSTHGSIHIYFEKNPFHWAVYDFYINDDYFKDSNGDGENAKSKRYVISRYGRYLEYAWRHRVPSRYLIGFLYQIGEAEVYRRANDSDAYESWYFPLRAKREAKLRTASSE